MMMSLQWGSGRYAHKKSPMLCCRSGHVVEPRGSPSAKYGGGVGRQLTKAEGKVSGKEVKKSWMQEDRSIRQGKVR